MLLYPNLYLLYRSLGPSLLSPVWSTLPINLTRKHAGQHPDPLRADFAHWVFLAKIKELHEHRFGSHFVNDFPWFPNQIDPIMKQPVHDSQSPRQEQITPNFTKMNTNFVCNVYGKLFSAKDTSNAKIFDRFPRILDIYFVSALSLSQWPELVFKHNNFSPKSWWGSPFSLKDECHQS